MKGVVQSNACVVEMNPARLAGDRAFDAVHGTAGGELAEEEPRCLGVRHERVAGALGTTIREAIPSSSFNSIVSIHLSA
jgi:hypothetical protein